MPDYRIKTHPILRIPKLKSIEFYWQGQKLTAQEGETIASALFANGIHIFGHHPKDGAPQGIFCANGQCSQCLVLANHHPVKSCMELVQPEMQVHAVDGLPELPPVNNNLSFNPPKQIDIPVLMIGGGPAGLSAGIELGKLEIKAILVDDKNRLGGKLVLQTHRFFGSTQAVFAGTRGIDIATRLEEQLRELPSIEIWLQSTALAVYSDKKVGIWKNGQEYITIKPEVLLVSSGARERSLGFKGNTLPGVYGAGAFQTLVNRDLVRPAKKLFIVGGGNVGLIAGYHALQAGIEVVGLVEVMPEVGGYKVHRDKIARMGVPIITSHTILSANGTDHVESVTISKVDSSFHPIPGSEKSFECDTLLIAVGLDPVNEFYVKASEYGLSVFAAGDAEEIAEASAAMFSGKIKGLEIARFLGISTEEIPGDWYRTMDILKSKPGQNYDEQLPDLTQGLIPVLHCTQEIPCDPCASLCLLELIQIDPQDIRRLPVFQPANDRGCAGCLRCVTGCPGLAITLVDFRKNSDFPTVSIPYEFCQNTIHPHDLVTVLDTQGKPLGEVEVLIVRSLRNGDRTLIIQVQAPREYARQIAGVRIQDEKVTYPLDHYIDHIADDAMVCRCERVTASEIRNLIRIGYRDLNEIKTVTRAGMGACGSKTCNKLIYQLFKEEGIPINQITGQVKRPLFTEVPLGDFVGLPKEEE